MTDLAKWVWIFLIIIFFVGSDIFYIIGVALVVFLLVLWLKPEWLNRM